MDELDSRTIQVLLRVIQSQKGRFPRTEALSAFIDAYQDIGRREGKSIYLTPSDKDRIANILAAEEIERDTPPDAWRGISRTDAITLGNNEKLSKDPVRIRRIAIKALRSSQELVLNGSPIKLPGRCHVEADYDAIDISMHDWIIVVENWESFNDVHMATNKLEFPGDNPIVVWRGDNSRTRADSVLNWVQGLTMPVAAFVDFDPKGLVIANGLPRLNRIISPPLNTLRELLRTRGIRERYLAQIPYCQSMLDRTMNPQIRELWQEMTLAGKALPQEHFAQS
jgi:hypothetical protein